ncbi:A/G-specific adenine glycosylase [Roseovarius sp. TE539]|uniref:A/G-specific adenine glycosylase n=1 Tax=Roseovarius sp. TE539 TaxID=2249812 RepID=UPI000DDE10FB|nr:A/G-specific adenine glycosylase [Roseovarius sp. TE539]RBI76997.1 A/G-specific adenine glycosylase [Roseovarius sp. TE539]
MRDAPLPETLLDWYDTHARDLPWRVGPSARAAGARPDPYAVWLSEIMLQQTTVAAVKGYFARFTKRWPDVDALAAAEDADVMGEWAGLGYYARARNLLKCARIVAEDHGGRFPDTRPGLQELPGIGPYTAAAIAAIAFDRPETVVDGNVERVMARLHDIRAPLPGAKPELTAAAAALSPGRRPGDYAQAVMDLGATICTPRAPACGICPWQPACAAHRAGTAAGLPAKKPKTPKPVRHGIAYVALREDGALLLERRPEKGLLGGMLGWPGSTWTEDTEPVPAPPLKADWSPLPAEARHTFTHFHLRLRIETARVPVGARAEFGEFVPPARFSPAQLPTVMRKVFDLAHPRLENDDRDGRNRP